MTKKFEVKIKYNQQNKWSVMVENVEYPADEVEIYSKSYTSEECITTKAKSINMATNKGVTKIVLR